MYVAEERESMERLMGEREEGWQDMEDDERLVDRACWDDTV